jgi:hypothetical protein
VNTKLFAELGQENYPKLLESLETITMQLDVVINLLLDALSDERFAEPRKVSHKVHRLALTRVALRDAHIGRIVGSPSKDVSSRLREYKSADVVRRQKKLKKK